MQTGFDFPGKITIISGKRDAGKTLLCIELKKSIAASNKTVSGVISPGLYQNGCKVGILAEDIASGESRQIAQFAPGWDADKPERIWKFDFSAIAWMDERLKAISVTDYLIIDEIGYLELQEQSGWKTALDKLDDGRFGQAFVVIRPDLLEIACRRWPKAEIVNVEKGNDLQNLVQQLLAQTSASE